jgi:hypothetical protein
VTARAHISWKTKYACALLKLGDVPYEHAKQIHQDQIISLYEVHHNKLHALQPDNHFSNLEPLLRPEHKARFPKDNAAAKKITRIARVTAEASRRLLAKHQGEPAPERADPASSPAASRKTRARKASADFSGGDHNDRHHHHPR